MNNFKILAIPLLALFLVGVEGRQPSYCESLVSDVNLKTCSYFKSRCGDNTIYVENFPFTEGCPFSCNLCQVNSNINSIEKKKV
jgi:hypothetical protein